MTSTDCSARDVVVQALSALRQPALVLHDDDGAAVAASLPHDPARLHTFGAAVPGAPRRWPAVLVVVRDELTLRRGVSSLPALGRTRTVVCWMLRTPEPALLVPRPEWPAVVRLRSLGADDGSVTVLDVEQPVGAGSVLAELARSLGTTPTASRGLVVGTARAYAGHVAPPADPGLVVAPTAVATADPERPTPPDAVLSADSGLVLPEHPVLGRAPTLVSDPVLRQGPLDEGVLNPVGFVRSPSRGTVDLTSDGAGSPQLSGGGLDAVSAEREVTPRLVSRLRDHRAVRVRWPGPDEHVRVTVRAAAALAMAGVPLVTGPVPPAAVGWLGPGLAAALSRPVDLDDDRDREEHSVRLRRAALLHHSTLGWRARTAARAGVPYRRFPTVSALVLPTPRDASQQVAECLEQQSVDDLRVVAVAQPGDRYADDVPWTRALEGAVGDVVLLISASVVPGPELVTDLLLARHYSGASLVEAPDELVVGADGDEVRHPISTETYASEPTGGPLLVGRALLLTTADQVLDPGALVRVLRDRGHDLYRTHGLSHVLRPTHLQETP